MKYCDPHWYDIPRSKQLPPPVCRKTFSHSYRIILYYMVHDRGQYFSQYCWTKHELKNIVEGREFATLPHLSGMNVIRRQAASTDVKFAFIIKHWQSLARRTILHPVKSSQSIHQFVYNESSRSQAVDDEDKITL